MLGRLKPGLQQGQSPLPLQVRFCTYWTVRAHFARIDDVPILSKDRSDWRTAQGLCPLH